MDKGASSYHLFLMGDQKGFCQIVYDYYDGLVLYLNTWLNNLYDAEDMAQETLVVLVSQKPVFKGKSSFKTWLYSIGRNVTIAYMRKNNHFKRRLYGIRFLYGGFYGTIDFACPLLCSERKETCE